MKRCMICHKEFDDGLHKDCGGNCLLCMAECGDPECAIEAVPYLHSRIHDWEDLMAKVINGQVSTEEAIKRTKELME